MPPPGPQDEQEKALVRQEVNRLGRRMLTHGITLGLFAYSLQHLEWSRARWVRVPLQSALVAVGLSYVGAACAFVSLFPWVRKDRVDELRLGCLEMVVYGPTTYDGHYRETEGYVQWKLGNYAIRLTS